MGESNFRKMRLFQRARVLACAIYRETQRFPRTEIFGLTQQMRRAAVSVLSNIAEGQGRWSRADARTFALIARGSILELEAQLIISGDLDFLPVDRAEELLEIAVEVARMLNALIRHYDRPRA